MDRSLLAIAIPLLSLLSAVQAASCSGDADLSVVKSWVYQLQDADPSEIAGLGFDLVVMDYSWDGTEEGEYTPEEIAQIKDAGMIPVAYISIGEAEDYRFYWQDEWYEDPPPWLGRENPEWEGNYAVKYWYPEWKQIIFSYLDRIISQGFRGAYLDRVDAFEYWSNSSNGEDESLPEDVAARRMIKFVAEIANYCRVVKGVKDFIVIPQNGERLLEYDENGTFLEAISGIAVEDLFYWETEPIPENEAMNRTVYLDMVLGARKPVFVVDYVDDGSGYEGENKERIDSFIAKARERGYIPYVARSDRELDEMVIIEGIQPPINATTITIKLKPGWNLVSIPVNLTFYASILPSSAQVYTWNPEKKQYEEARELQPKTGYWVYVPIEANFTVFGPALPSYSKHVPAGWNLVGSTSHSESKVKSGFLLYRWNPELRAYTLATALKLGEAGWIYLKAPETIQVTAA